jgi:DeoR family transcriptional regulator, aga operon transcriptional repressor
MKALFLQRDISVDELVAQIGTSAPQRATRPGPARKLGLIRRTHGGATLVEPLLYEPFHQAPRGSEAQYWAGHGGADPRERDYRSHGWHYNYAGRSLRHRRHVITNLLTSE